MVGDAEWAFHAPVRWQEACDRGCLGLCMGTGGHVHVIHVQRRCYSAMFHMHIVPRCRPHSAMFHMHVVPRSRIRSAMFHMHIVPRSRLHRPWVCAGIAGPSGVQALQGHQVCRHRRAIRCTGIAGPSGVQASQPMPCGVHAVRRCAVHDILRLCSCGAGRWLPHAAGSLTTRVGRP